LFVQLQALIPGEANRNLDEGQKVERKARTLPRARRKTPGGEKKASGQFG